MAETMTAPTYSAYWLYRLDPAFHQLDEGTRERGKQEFLAALEERDASVRLRGVYRFAGLRADADLMLWVLGQDLDAIERLAIALRQSGLGRYLQPKETYIGVTSPARYDPQHMPAFLAGVPPKQYISVYPFVKTTEWYLLPYERRRELMAEHGWVGRRYAVSRAKLTAYQQQAGATNGNGRQAAAVQTHSQTQTLSQSQAATATDEEEGGGVLSNTVDSFGLGDYEFILANESDDPSELARMMMDLRATEVRRYTKLDTPIYFGRLREPAEALAVL
jgi:peroxiredoxin